MDRTGARLGALLLIALAGTVSGADLYVSASGGPSLERALAEARELRQRRPDEPVTVWLAPGTYFLERTLELSPADSGTSLRRLGQGAVRLSGGRDLPGERFQVATDPRLDPLARGHVLSIDLGSLGLREFGDAGSVNRSELVFDDEPMPLARWPNEGFASDLQTAGGEPFAVHGLTGDRSGVLAYAGERPARWHGEKDLLLHGYWFWDWSDGYQRVAEIDSVQHLLELASPQHLYGYRSGARYYALNALVELDRPGEWYLDRDAAVLYLWPPAPVERARIVLSRLDAPLVALRGASDVTLEGLTFEAGRAGALEIKGGERNVVRDCMVRNVGGDAIVISGGREHRVEGCDIRHISAAAVVVSGGDRRTLEPAGHTVRGNRIRDYARVQRTYAAAIRLDGVGQSAIDNDIGEAPHLAIYFFGNEHRIQGNEIHDVARETGDSGAIYTGRDWTARGTLIRGNHIHDVHGLHDVQGIYLDDAASGITVADNLIERVDRAMLAGGGRENVLEGNRMLDCRESLAFDNRGLSWMKSLVTPPDGAMVRRLAAMPVTEPPWAERYPRLARLMDDDPGAPKYNIVRGNLACRCAPPSIAPEVATFGHVADNRVTTGPCPDGR